MYDQNHVSMQRPAKKKSVVVLLFVIEVKPHTYWSLLDLPALSIYPVPRPTAADLVVVLVQVTWAKA